MRILFLIRDKFGDSVIAAVAALDYANKNPQDSCTILIRSQYIEIIKQEKNIKFVPYYFRPQAFLWAWLQKWCGRKFDILCVLRGFGGQSVRLAKVIPANKKVVPEHLLIDFPATIIKKPQSNKISQPLLQYSVDLINGFCPAYINPNKLELPKLMALAKNTPKILITICPIASENRRTLTAEGLKKLVEYLKNYFPKNEIAVLLRNKAELKYFSEDILSLPILYYQNIKTLINIFKKTEKYYGVDSGHYHLACAMGLECTVFFGPSEPSYVVLAEQKNAMAIRQTNLGEKFCENISCKTPYCLDIAINQFINGDNSIIGKNKLPDKCLLK